MILKKTMLGLGAITVGSFCMAAFLPTTVGIMGPIGVLSGLAFATTALMSALHSCFGSGANSSPPVTSFSENRTNNWNWWNFGSRKAFNDRPTATVQRGSWWDNLFSSSPKVTHTRVPPNVRVFGNCIPQPSATTRHTHANGFTQHRHTNSPTHHVHVGSPNRGAQPTAFTTHFNSFAESPHSFHAAPIATVEPTHQHQHSGPSVTVGR